MRSQKQDFSYYAKKYLNIWDDYLKNGFDQALDLTDKENDFSEDWRREHYFSVGADAARLITSNLLAAEREPPRKVLDFPCGSGRVTRHLRALFPDAEIGACDLYRQHVDFCARQFNGTPLQSKENIADLDVGTWDLIFCGSLLTHLPQELFWSAVRFMARSLTPNGIAVVTLEGRHSIYIQRHKWKLIEDSLFDVAHEGYSRTGFGFVDYNHEFRSDKFGNQENYGVALTSPQWLMRGLTEIEDVRVLSFTERAWDDHQDMVVFGVPGVNVET